MLLFVPALATAAFSDYPKDWESAFAQAGYPNPVYVRSGAGISIAGSIQSDSERMKREARVEEWIQQQRLRPQFNDPSIVTVITADHYVWYVLGDGTRVWITQAAWRYCYKRFCGPYVDPNGKRDLSVEFTFLKDMVSPSYPWDASHTPIEVRVTDRDGTPAVGVELSVTNSVVEKSGGHEHHDAKRPAGSLTSPTCEVCEGKTVSVVTDGSGEAILDFLAPEVSGTHRLSVTCSDEYDCTISGPSSFTVKVDNLVSLGTSPDFVLIGKTDTHPDNHYFTSAMKDKLKEIAGKYASTFDNDPVLHINDGSLVWGGAFDVGTRPWRVPHKSHRYGTDVDIRSSSTQNVYKEGAVPLRNHFGFEKIVRANGCSFILEYQDKPQEHYHLRCK